MATPKKVTQENWYDIWADWPAADRAAAIRVLEQTHRQLVKVENRAAPHGTKEINLSVALPQGKLEGICPECGGGKDGCLAGCRFGGGGKS